MTLFRGDTVSRYYYFRDKAQALFDPDSTTCEIFGPDGVSVETVVLTQVSQGKYEMNYNIPDDAVYGVWKIVVTGVKGAYQNAELFEFEVREE